MNVAVIGAESGAIVRALRAVGIAEVCVYEPVPAGDRSRSPVGRQRRTPWTSRHRWLSREDRPVPRRLVDVDELVFDEDEDRWLIHLVGDEPAQARVVILTADTTRRLRADFAPKAADRFVGVRLPVTGREARTLDAAWSPAPVTFRGIATHGFPNLFFVGGAEPAVQEPSVAQSVRVDLVATWVRALQRQSGTRIEVRASTQHEYHRRLDPTPSMRRHGRPKPHHFDITVAADRHPDHDYAGPAVLDLPGAEYSVLATLTGHLDPIDGRYHWYGRLDPTETTTLPEPTRASAFLVLPGREPAAAHLTERDPWGNLRVTGIGTPPFALEA
ncbi:DUF4873 domain-containing protein [Nocardia salmonicida]|uniref:DUF4873 domain-containing protein n=1 Tax=Nocardia salmonicida TaxID=53431 RepID=UPI002E2DC494|nr:DUF4873 domain-containing protein [Nocardia salmonicida]